MAADLDDWIDQPTAVEFVTREEDSEPQQTRYTLEGADESERLALTARFTVVGLVDNSQHARNSLERPGR